MEVLVFDRTYPEWWPYTQFLSPLEHRTERDTLRIEEDRKALLARLAELEQTSADTAQRTALYNLLTFVVIGVVGLLLAALAIGATLYPDQMRAILNAVGEWLRNLIE